MGSVSASTVCAACEDPLIVQLGAPGSSEDESQDESHETSDSFVDDDVQLPCACHFHWQCLLDAYTVTECPKCDKQLSTMSEEGNLELRCNLRNEGGFQQDLDILPLLTEEAYLKAYPEDRKCQAFLEFCAEGDIDAIIHLLGNDEHNVEDLKQIILYQDQIKTMRSGLHMAIFQGQILIAWLLLWLGSGLHEGQFPDEVLSAAGTIGLGRQPWRVNTDIRSLLDSDGVSVEQAAARSGQLWHEWVQSGRLAVPL